MIYFGLGICLYNFIKEGVIFIVIVLVVKIRFVCLGFDFGINL